MAIKAIEFGEKRKKAITPLKVIEVVEVGINRKPVCDFLLVIICNWQSLTVAELPQLIIKILDTLRFETPFGGLGKMYDVHLGLIGKRLVDFLLATIELFLLGVTAEALRAKTDRKSAIVLRLTQNFR